MSMCDGLNWIAISGLDIGDFSLYLSAIYGLQIEGISLTIPELELLKFNMSLPGFEWPYARFAAFDIPAGPSFASILLLLNAFKDYCIDYFGLVGVPDLPDFPMPTMPPFPQIPDIPDFFIPFMPIEIPDFNIAPIFFLPKIDLPFPFDFMIEIPNTNVEFSIPGWPGGFGFIDFCIAYEAMLEAIQTFTP